MPDAGYSPAQLKNAKVIAGVGTLRGASKDDIVTALMVALAESDLQNYANTNVPESLGIPHENIGSDHNSVGLFQQQVGIWGTAPDLMNPAGSAKKFYDALGKTPAGEPWIRAQAVQKSAFPDGRNYRDRYAAAQALYAASVDGKYVPSQNGPFTPDAGNPVPAWVGAAATAGALLGDPEFWKRVGLFALGGVLLLLAVLKLTGAGDQLVTAGKLAAKVAL